MEPLFPLKALRASVRKQAEYEIKHPQPQDDAPTRLPATVTLEQLDSTICRFHKLPSHVQYYAVLAYLLGSLYGRTFAETFEPGYFPLKLPEIGQLFANLRQAEGRIKPSVAALSSENEYRKSEAAKNASAARPVWQQAYRDAISAGSNAPVGDADQIVCERFGYHKDHVRRIRRAERWSN